MPRTRPRLKQTLVTCSRPGCRNQAIRYYPARESVRRKLSPWRYCSTRCARQHWEERAAPATRRGQSTVPVRQFQLQRGDLAHTGPRAPEGLLQQRVPRTGPRSNGNAGSLGVRSGARRAIALWLQAQAARAAAAADAHRRGFSPWLENFERARTRC